MIDFRKGYINDLTFLFYLVNHPWLKSITTLNSAYDVEMNCCVIIEIINNEINVSKIIQTV